MPESATDPPGQAGTSGETWTLPGAHPIRPEPAHILIVDDQETDLLVLKSILAPMDLSVATATSGKDAILAVRKRRFALILLDVYMPGMSGVDTAQAIRLGETGPPTPIVFVTAAGPEEIGPLETRCPGPIDFLFKPYSPRSLRTRVQTYLELHRATSRVRELEAALEDAAVASKGAGGGGDPR